MSLSADTFSSLVSEANQMPDVRGEVVDAFKSRVQSGDYPSSETLDGLADVMGNHWSQFAAGRRCVRLLGLRLSLPRDRARRIVPFGAFFLAR